MKMYGVICLSFLSAVSFCAMKENKISRQGSDELTQYVSKGSGRFFVSEDGKISLVFSWPYKDTTMCVERRVCVKNGKVTFYPQDNLPENVVFHMRSGLQHYIKRCRDNVEQSGRHFQQRQQQQSLLAQKRIVQPPRQLLQQNVAPALSWYTLPLDHLPLWNSHVLRHRIK